MLATTLQIIITMRSAITGPFVGLFLMAVMLPFVNSKVRKQNMSFTNPTSAPRAALGGAPSSLPPFECNYDSLSQGRRAML